MTMRVLVIGTETVGGKALTHMTEYVPCEDGIGIDHDRDTPRTGFSSDDHTATISMVNPAITHYTSTAPVGSAHVAHHLGVLPEPMDYLQYQWDYAEVPTEDNPIRKGDTLIRKDDDASIDVWECQTGYHPAVGDTRVLRRAPRREPWEDLADVLGDMGHLSPTGHAKALHDRGVRVVGGDAA